MAEVKVCAYPTAKSLPLHVGIERGIFTRFGIEPIIHFTDNSRTQRDSLAAGTSHIVHLAVDNAIAMVDDDGLDVVIVSGGDSGMNELFVQPDIAGIADLRGKRLVVDAPDTAYALQAIKILANHGLVAGRDYVIDAVGRGELRLKAMAASTEAAAAVLNPPYSFEAEDMGLKSLGATVALLGPYQASGGFVMRPWALANRATLERYLAGYITSLRWVLEPANREAATAMLVDRLGVTPSIAARSYAALVAPQLGFTPDAALEPAGLDNTLALRRETVGQGAGRRPAAGYVDLSYYDAALRLAAGRPRRRRRRWSAASVRPQSFARRSIVDRCRTVSPRMGRGAARPGLVSLRRKAGPETAAPLPHRIFISARQ